MNRLTLPLLASLLLAACHPGGGKGDVPGNSEDHRPFAGIGRDEELRFTGTEPFWGGVLTGDRLVYTTPGNPQGVAIAVSRFAGRNGIGLSGMLDGKSFDMTVTPGACSDGMSDRSYPFTVTLSLGGEQRAGCAWGSRHPFAGPRQP